MNSDIIKSAKLTIEGNGNQRISQTFFIISINVYKLIYNNNSKYPKQQVVPLHKGQAFEFIDPLVLLVAVDW